MSFLESPCRILATTGTPPSRHVPELGGIPCAGLVGDDDALDQASVNRASQANNIAILERLPPTPPSATDVTIASPPPQESDTDAEFTGDPPPLTSHDQYEVV